jgi:hypothetical protein
LIENAPIELIQYGGITKDEKGYIFVEDGGFLNIDEYYLILTVPFQNGGLLDVTEPSRIISLGKINDDIIKSTINGTVSKDNDDYLTHKKTIAIIEKYLISSKNEISPNIEIGEKNPTKDISKYDINYKKD